MEIKKGDKVKIIQRKTGNTTGSQNCGKPNGDVGSIGSITEINRYSSYCVEDGSKYYGWFDKDDLELVTDEFILPEKWCVKVGDPATKDVFHKWRISNTNYSGYAGSVGYLNQDGFFSSEKLNMGVEMTFEQFKAHVLKETMEPKQEDLTGRWLKVINNSCIDHYPCKKGDYMKFVCIKDGMEYWGAYDSDCNSDGTNNSRYFGYSVHTIDKFELMPEGFNPDKPTFEVGKWYKYSPWYLKLDYVNDSNVFVACETIDCNGRYENRDGEYFTCGEANHTKTLLTDLTEIQQYLPDGHVDKVKPIPEYVESNRSIYGMKKGKIYKVGTDGFILELPEHTYYTTEFVKSSTKEAYDAQFKTMEKNEFRKGDYIVCLKKPNSILDYIRPNFIFKQLKHSDGVYAEIDIKGSVTTCSDVSFKDTSTWRYATPEEMAEYDRLGKPYDVTTLVGKEQPMEDILEEAKRRYPVGTILKCLILNKDVKVTSHSTNLLNKVTQIYFQVEGNHTLVYSEGKWAEIVTPVVEPKAAKYIPKVGDWVITEGYSDNYDGKPLKINKINDGIFCFFDEVNFYENYSKSHNFHIDKAIRKAESHKIPKTGEPIQSFVVGKWYKNHPKINTYAKCLKPTSGGFKYEEAIFSGEYHKGAVSTWGKHSEMIEASLDEIQEFLPNFHSDKVFVSSKPHEYTPEEALAELKRRGFKKGVKYVYMYENGTYDEKDIRTANYEPCISGKQYIDCGGGYLWSKENPSHLHRGPVSKVNPCVEIFLPPSPQVSLWGELAPSTPNYLDPASLLKKVQLPI